MSRSLALCLRLVPILFVLSCGGGSNGNPSGPSTSGLTGSLTATFSVANANPGDGIQFTITLPGGVATGSLLLLQLSFQGQGGPVDTLAVPANYGSLVGSLSLPDGLPDGVLTVTAALPAYHLTTSASVHVVDTDPPTIETAGMNSFGVPFSLVMAPGAPALFIGATDTISVSATDNGGLTTIGFSLGAPANITDSVSVQDLTGSLSVAVQIQNAWLGSTMPLAVYARDRDGNVTTKQLGNVAVAAHVTRPVKTAALDTSFRDVVFDRKRGVAYVAVGDQSTIQVLSLATMTYGTPIALPTAAVGLDVRPGGDSLVVALAHTADLAIINLAAGPGAPTVVHLNSFNGAGADTVHLADTVEGVRVASDGRMIVLFEGSQGTGFAQFDPSTGRDSIVLAQNMVLPNLLRSGDGSKVMIVNVPISGAIVYDASTHTYGSPTNANTNSQYRGPLSTDMTGAYVSSGDQLFDSTFRFLGICEVATENALFPPSLLSPGGTQFYVAVTEPGEQLPYYMRFRVPVLLNPTLSNMIGVPIDVVDTPEPINRFVPLADTTALLAFGADKAMLFDLTQSSPSMSRVRLARSAAHPAKKVVAARAAAKPLVLRLRVGGRDFSVPIVVPGTRAESDRQAHAGH